MKLGDRTRFGSDADIIANIKRISELLGDAASKVHIKDKDDYIGFALQRLAMYVQRQLQQLASLYNGPIELHGWFARNLFETYLLCEYLLRDTNRAKKFIAQKGIDELQISEGLLSLSKDPKDPSAAPVKARIDHIRRTLAKHGLAESSHWSVSMLAKDVGCREDYEAFFKLYSKYVHPSSWTVNAEPSEIDNPSIRNIFLVQAQYYSGRIASLIGEHGKSRGNVH